MVEPQAVLSEPEILERIGILFTTDAPECEGCGTSALGVADDAGWFIDTEAVVPAEGEPYAVSIIRCPRCW